MYVVFFFVDGNCMSLATTVLVRSSQTLKIYLLLIPCIACLALLNVSVVLYGEFGFYSYMMFAVSLMLVTWSARKQFLSSNLCRLEIDREGRMVLCDIYPVLGVESVRAMSLKAPIVVWPHLILLHIHDESGARRYLLIFRDAVSENAFRQLRVVLTSLAQRRQHALHDNNQMTEGNF
jgi:hypothetical protein